MRELEIRHVHGLDGRIDVFDGPTRIGCVEPSPNGPRLFFAHSRHREHPKFRDDPALLLAWIERARARSGKV